MKKYLFSALIGFACLFPMQSASALFGFGGSGNPFCDNSCNRGTCKIQEVQNLCRSQCPASSVTNCLAASSTPAAVAAGSLISTFCSQGCNMLTCTQAPVKGVCALICDKDSIEHCLAAPIVIVTP